MAEVIRMPKMSDTMEEGVIASWAKKVGDEVRSGDVLAEVETDKATMELESYNDGTLLYIGVQEQEAVAVDGVIAIIGEKGEDITDMIKEFGSGSPGPPTEKEEIPSANNVNTGGSINAMAVKMPKMSDTMTEGVIASWAKKEGDRVESGDILAEVETDKATMELEAYEDGILLHVAVPEGGAVPVDGVIAIIGEEGADWKTLLEAGDTGNPEVVPAPPKHEETAPVSSGAAEQATNDGGRVKASPLAKKMAAEKGYNIGQIPGTGEGGRIVKKDVENFVPEQGFPKQDATSLPATGEESYEDAPVSQMRKAIARSLTASQFGAPHFYLTTDMDMDKTIEARKSINEVAPVKISFNDIVVKAVSVALRKHPDVNTYYMADSNTIRKNKHVHIGVAMAIPDGLVVPVVKFADNKNLARISAEVREFASKAKEKKITPDEMRGNTFTVSNLGMFGIEQFTSIINAPESCILAVGAINQVPVVKDGQIVPGNMMKVTLTCDHRTVDGAVGAAFLKTLKELIEDPVRILI